MRHQRLASAMHGQHEQVAWSLLAPQRPACVPGIAQPVFLLLNAAHAYFQSPDGLYVQANVSTFLIKGLHTIFNYVLNYTAC